ncbi:uncharacterized protein J3D65DRAFT_631794 [Phyllosticta citribraziliensis]|uniref:Uncharacterized protein n=1 Tax=Phyllosticta citribraziliensis TaxID=989973 RepID=A0ABR1LFC3_9PEZI
MASPQAEAPAASDNIYAQVDGYPWDSDCEFQGGLSAILGANPSADQAIELTLRARCFYYTRKFNIPVDFDAYKAYRASIPSPPPITPVTTNGLATPTSSSSTSASPQPQTQLQPAAPSSSTPPQTQASSSSASAPAASSSGPDDAPYPTSFAHIVELITTGQPIPGIKEIPDTVLEGQGTTPAAAKRRKPWERSEDATAGAAAAAAAGSESASRPDAAEAQGAQ